MSASMKFCFLFLSFSLLSFVPQTNAAIPLDDVMSPDDIALELGLPPQSEELILEIETVEDISRREGVDITREWPIVVWINKSDRGPTSQKMRVYYRGRLAMEALVSTGRERQEKAKNGKEYFSATPVGWFNPTRLVENHFSDTWQVDMPHAIFFNGGIATHATFPVLYPELGKRASGGCIRLRAEAAEWLFNLVKNEPRTTVPVFSRHGGLAKNVWGNIRKRHGSATLVIVEDSLN